MKPYPKYKHSNIEWIGNIPEHWELKKLKYTGFLYSGLSGKSGQDFKQEDSVLNKPFIPFTNIANNEKINPIFLQNVIIEESDSQNKVEQFDLFFMMSSENFDDIGKSTILLDNIGEVYLNSFCKGFRIVDKKIQPIFLNYLLLNHSYRKRLMIEANGFTRINLKMEKLNDFKIEIPPLSEQQAIANFLDNKTAAIDQAIADKEALIALYEEEKKALINEAVTKGIKKNTPLNPSGIDWLGDIPTHWQVKKLKYVVNKIGSGVTPRGGSDVYELDGIPLIRSQNIYNDGLRLDDVAFITNEIHNSMSGSKVQKNDILLNITGASLGRCYYFDGTISEANVNQHVCIIRVNDTVSFKFIYYCIISDFVFKQIENSYTGSGREGLSNENLGNFYFTIPPLLEQEAIVQYIESASATINEKIETTQQEINLLKEYRQALIFEAVTGKIDVR